MSDPLNVAGEFSDGDDGRLPASVPPEMLGAFRTPMLRCVSRRPSFMHIASLRSLRDVVAFFDEGGHGQAIPGVLGQNELAPLGLTEQQIDDIVAFLYSVAELRALVATIDAPNWVWDIGTIRLGNAPMHGTYLIGYPTG